MKPKWIYSKKVKDHFFNPRNIQKKKPKRGEFDGTGTVGSPVCGDMMQVWIKVDPKDKSIEKMTWKTFGCASAIASTSVLSEMVKGMSIDQAKKITPKDIIGELGGLPKSKIHCSVLGDQALRKAIKKYSNKND